MGNWADRVIRSTAPPLMASLIERAVQYSEFALVGFNVRSIFPKIDSLDLLIQEAKPDVVNINETWLNSAIPDSSISIEGYSVIRQDRTRNTRGGGLASYIRKDNGAIYDNVRFSELSISDSDIELHVFSLKVRMMKKMLILNTYRPPSGNITQFFEKLKDSISKVKNLNEYEIYITGDLNIPYNDTKSQGFSKIQTFAHKFGLEQLITSPTRCTFNSSNILDLILTNGKCIKVAETSEVNLSDHQPTYIIRKKSKTPTERTEFTCRTYKHYVKEDYQSELNELDWSDFFSSPDVDSAWDILYKEILNAADKHCPLRTFTRLKKLPPWLIPELLELMKERDITYKTAKLSGSLD